MNRELRASATAYIRASVAVAFGLSALSLTLAASASAAVPTWLAPLDLSAPGQDASRPKVTIDQQGNSTAVWERFDGSNWIIQSAGRPLGGDWSEPVDLSVAGQDAELPQVAVDSKGNATASWERFDGSNWIIQSAERPAGGSWSEPVDLSDAGQDAVSSKVAVDSQGKSTAVWRRFDGSTWIIQSAERPAGGVWSEPVDLSAAGEDAKFAGVAVDSHGNVTAVWHRNDGTYSIIQSAKRPAGGDWSEPVDVSKGSQKAASPQVAVDPQGNATAVWERYDAGPFIVQSAERPAGADWSEPVDVSAAGNNAFNIKVAVDQQGNATAVWERFDGSNWIIQSAGRPAGGDWSEPVDVSAAGEDAEWPSVTVDSPSNATVIWRRFNGSNWIIQSAERMVGGAWSEPVDVSATGEDASIPQAAVDSEGNAMAVWRRFDGSNWIIQGAERVAGDTDTLALPSIASEPTPQSPRRTITFAARIARVVRGRALLRMYCHGEKRCQGIVKLNAPAGKRWVNKRNSRRAKHVLIGKARFSIPPDRKRVIRVRMNHKGAALLSDANRHQLKVKLQGRGVNRRWVILRQVGHIAGG